MKCKFLRTWFQLSKQQTRWKLKDSTLMFYRLFDQDVNMLVFTTYIKWFLQATG